MKIDFQQGAPPSRYRSNRNPQSRGGCLSISIRSLFVIMILSFSIPQPLMNQSQADTINTSQDRTVATLDVINTCSSSIADTISTNDGPRGDDQNLHDEDDIAESAFQDGFDEQSPTPTVDFSDNEFSHTARTTGGLFGAGLEPSSTNIIVDDPDAVAGVDTDGSGYVDLELYNASGNAYAAVFNDQITCDTSNGYDLHIADTFNMDPGSFKVGYDTRDIAIDDQVYKPNLNKREGLFRIAPGSDRDIVEADLISGFETQTIKHEYVMDLPAVDNCGSMTSDDYIGDCEPASLDPFGVISSLRMRTWPYVAGTPPDDNDFGTVGFTLLCDQNGDTGAVTAGTGRINPFTRGLTTPGTGQGRRFREDSTNDDCNDAASDPEEYYAAIPSLLDFGDYDGIAGTDPSTYGAILSAANWVGFSGIITDPVPVVVDNYLEVRAQLPDNQIAGSYAGTIILSCLPNLTVNNKADFDFDGVGNDPDPISFQSTGGSDYEDVTPVNLPVTLSEQHAVPVMVDYTITGGTALSGTDYTISSMSGTLTFPPFTQLVYIPTINIIDDGDIEDDETIIITLSNPNPPYVLIGDYPEYTYTILDDDLPEITCVGAYNWARGFNFSQDCSVTAGGSYTLTFSTDMFCDLDNTAVTLLGADGAVLYSDSCSGGLANSTTYNVGPFVENFSGTAALVLSDSYGDGGIYNILWKYQP